MRRRATLVAALVLTGGLATAAATSLVPTVDAQNLVSTEDRSIVQLFDIVGVDDVPVAVRERLRLLLQWAAAQQAWPSQPPTPTASAWPGAVQHWRDVAPEWRQAAEGFAEQRRSCRQSVRSATTSATPPDCARALAAELRLRHAEHLVASLPQRLQQADALPEPARSRVTKALTQVRERATERLRVLQDHDDPALDGVPDLDRDRIRERLRELAELSPPSSTTSSSSSPSSTAPPSSGPPTSVGGTTSTIRQRESRQDDDKKAEVSR